jgi:hypothetical protein
VSARGLQSQYSGVAGGSRAEKLNYAEAEVGDGKAQVTCTTPDLIIIAPATPTQFAFGIVPGRIVGMRTACAGAVDATAVAAGWLAATIILDLAANRLAGRLLPAFRAPR